MTSLKNRYLASATLLALTTAIISGANNFLTKTAVTAIADPVVFTTLKNGIVALFLLGLLIALKKGPEIISLNRRQLLKLGAIGVIGGSLPFIMFFAGLQQTSAINAAFIHKSLFIWVALLAIPLLKERMNGLQWVGIGTIAVANLAIGGFRGFNFDSGELLILGATLFWAVENIIAKIALRDISSMTVAAARMTLGSLLLGIVMIWQGGLTTAASLGPEQWLWTLLTAVLLSGYVLTWYAALQKAPATYVATLLVSATLVTNILTAAFVTHSLQPLSLIAMLLLTAGVGLIVAVAHRPSDEPQGLAASGARVR
ncbi:hypothetical protein AMJ57_04670 [Parcubacteria bacterium SG8_24]|nr:MAG: hypothetical protein AMJ57_04670 [Parcubacteria bacterium SG8_24]